MMTWGSNLIRLAPLVIQQAHQRLAGSLVCTPVHEKAEYRRKNIDMFIVNKLLKQYTLWLSLDI